MKTFRFQISGRRVIADWRLVAAMALMVVAVWSAPAIAQQQDPPPPPQAEQVPPIPPPAPESAATDGFLPMSQAAPREVLPATPLVFYAYAFVWLVLIGYVFLMWRRMARVEQDLADVQRRLQDGQGGR